MWTDEISKASFNGPIGFNKYKISIQRTNKSTKALKTPAVRLNATSSASSVVDPKKQFAELGKKFKKNLSNFKPIDRSIAHSRTKQLFDPIKSSDRVYGDKIHNLASLSRTSFPKKHDPVT